MPSLSQEARNKDGSDICTFVVVFGEHTSRVTPESQGRIPLGALFGLIADTVSPSGL